MPPTERSFIPVRSRAKRTPLMIKKCSLVLRAGFAGECPMTDDDDGAVPDRDTDFCSLFVEDR